MIQYPVKSYRNGVVRKIEVMTYWSVKFLVVDSGSVAVEALLHSVLGFAHILHSTYPARNKINNINGSACDVPFDPV